MSEQEAQQDHDECAKSQTQPKGTASHQSFMMKASSR